MEAQSVPQRQGPGQAVILGDIAFQHLRLGDAVCVHREQGVEHHHDVVAGDERADGWVQQCQIGIGNEFQRRRRFRANESRSGEGGSGRLQEGPAAHG